MPSIPDARPEAALRKRREHRRRQVRRRRIAALAVLAAVVLASVALAALALGAGRTEDAARTAPASTDVRPRTSPTQGAGSGKAVTLAFAGDVHFESPIRERLLSSPASVLAPVAPVLRRADLALVNVETAVTDRGEPAPKEFVFRAPGSAFSALAAGGVDVATVANNHGMDYGTVGLADTLEAARRSGVQVIGAGRNDAQAYAPYRATINGQRIAVIGATQVLDDNLISAWTAGRSKMGLASAKKVKRLVRAVREARATSDTVVVFVHWGVELEACATPRQRALARTLVDAGADVIVGSHAHVLLGAGRLGAAFVDYGLGNFVFYASRPSTTATGVVEVTIAGRKLEGYRFVPARISGGIPYPLSGAERAQALAQWRGLRSCTGLGR